MTAEEFEAEYAARSGITVAELRAAGLVVVACSCGDEGCEGWAVEALRALGQYEYEDLSEVKDLP